MPTVLITGTSSGIGKACVELFANHGWDVIATMRRPDRAEEFNWPSNVHPMALDLNDAESVESAKQEALSRFGSVDVVVNNAGYGLTGAIETCSEAQIRASFDTNYFGTVRVMRAFLPEMRDRGQGTVITVTSIGGRFAFPFYGYYNAAKHALEATSEALWYELYDSGVRVKVVEPGFTQTEFATKGLILGEMDIPFYRDRIRRLTERLKAGTSGTPPRELAQLIYRAATDPSRRFRYAGGLYARPLLLLRRLLPESVFLALIRRNTDA